MRYYTVHSNADNCSSYIRSILRKVRAVHPDATHYLCVSVYLPVEQVAKILCSFVHLSKLHLCIINTSS